MANQNQLSLEDLKKENDALKAQLTNKNEQYIMQLDRVLRASNYGELEREKAYASMLPEIVSQQKSGVTARQLFGTVSQKADDIMNGKAKANNGRSSDALIWLDGSLLLGAIFALMSGVSGYLNPAQAQGMGIVTLIINFIIGGGILLLLSKYMPDYSKPKGQRGYWRYFGVSIAAMLVWLIVVIGSQTAVPANINISLASPVYLVIGAASFGLRWYLRRTLNITGTLF
ncbi:DUF1129 domain-containing protein [Granulicatella seriolae]|uniref:DUF1129 domain-containing protein n=1 Tax=Granulicatella seriolae TaxID=2967226 RepID=A0ABT1WQH3_9LACT|nr:DUF1129 domain-containing protein [Granulicatella seriolae]